MASKKKSLPIEPAEPKPKKPRPRKVKEPSFEEVPLGTKPRNLIQVWLVAVIREHYDDVPLDWPDKLIAPLSSVVIRPRPKGQAVLRRPVSTEVLGPEAVIDELRERLGPKFMISVVSDGT